MHEQQQTLETKDAHMRTLVVELALVKGNEKRLQDGENELVAQVKQLTEELNTQTTNYHNTKTANEKLEKEKQQLKATATEQTGSKFNQQQQQLQTAQEQLKEKE